MADEEKRMPLAQLEVFSSSSKQVSPGPTDIASLLFHSASTGTVTKTVLETNTSAQHLLLVVPTTLPAKETTDAAAARLSQWLMASVSTHFESLYSTPANDFLAVVVPQSQGSTRGSSFSGSDRWEASSRKHQSLFQQWAVTAAKWQQPGTSVSTHRKSTSSKTMSVIASALVITAATLFAAWVFLQPKEPDSVFVQYDDHGSVGPKYTSLLSPSNVSEWVQNHYNPADYYWRIDEQALVPIELLDEQEMRYQEYLATRYPEKAEIMDSDAWKDPEFFEDPNNFMVPTDMAFHRGHCVRAIRRYWQAKETGLHVCPWDLDYLHLHHCFSMLEDLIYVPGPREQRPDRVLSMSWRTKVCAWDPVDKIKP